jgi:hypothetical protein
MSAFIGQAGEAARAGRPLRVSGSEPESLSGVPEQRAKTRMI